MKIIEYNLLGYINYDAFVCAVNEAIEEGWQPYGITFMHEEMNQLYYYQAMVKYEEENPTRYIAATGGECNY